MALTPEQQAQVDVQIAIEAERNKNQLAFEAVQQANRLEAQAKQTRLEAVRMAKETLLENARSKPVDSRDVSAADITAFASALTTYVNG